MVPLAIQPGAQRGLSCWFKEVTKPNEMAPDQMVRGMTDLRDKPREGQPWISDSVAKSHDRLATRWPIGPKKGATDVRSRGGHRCGQHAPGHPSLVPEP